MADESSCDGRLPHDLRLLISLLLIIVGTSIVYLTFGQAIRLPGWKMLYVEIGRFLARQSEERLIWSAITFVALAPGIGLLAASMKGNWWLFWLSLPGVAASVAATYIYNDVIDVWGHIEAAQKVINKYHLLIDEVRSNEGIQYLLNPYQYVIAGDERAPAELVISGGICVRSADFSTIYYRSSGTVQAPFHVLLKFCEIYRKHKKTPLSQILEIEDNIVDQLKKMCHEWQRVEHETGNYRAPLYQCAPDNSMNWNCGCEKYRYESLNVEAQHAVNYYATLFRCARELDIIYTELTGELHSSINKMYVGPDSWSGMTLIKYIILEFGAQTVTFQTPAGNFLSRARRVVDMELVKNLLVSKLAATKITRCYKVSVKTIEGLDDNLEHITKFTKYRELAVRRINII